jgi:hypothetical protein
MLFGTGIVKTVEDFGRLTDVHGTVVKQALI